MELLIKQIKVADRGRKEFGGVEELANSIAEHGLMHPVVVRREEDGGYKLVAGERRLRAFCMLGRDRIPCTLFEDVGELKHKEMELDENIMREDLTWPERIEITRQIDEIKRELYGGPGTDGWTLDDTAETVGRSTTVVKREVKFARDLKARPDLFEQVKGMPMRVAMKIFSQKIDAEKAEEEYARKGGDDTGMVLLGDAVEVIQGLDTDSIDLLITDPPFGIRDLQQEPGKGQATQPYKQTLHDDDNLCAEMVVDLFDRLVPELARVMKPSSHMYIFFAIEMYQPLMDRLCAEFEMDLVPIIWDKGGTTVPFSGYKYAACYEPILFGHVPPRSKRIARPCRKVLGGQGEVSYKPVHSTKKLHPFEKPLDLLRYFIEQSSNMGDVVLDPFAGSMSTAIACKMSGREYVVIEKNKEHYYRGKARLDKDLSEVV